MIRRFALVLLPLCLAGLGYVVACGGEKDFEYDAGPGPQPVVDAGPCDVYAQTNCPTDLKCTIKPDGTPICGNKGTGVAYTACADDTQCVPGTACVDLRYQGFIQGNYCFPFCKIAAQPTDGGTTCPGTNATCISLTYSDGGLQIPEGFCNEASADGGVP